ncbi:putative WEB family protein At4g17210 [Cucurbita maxima]|uniref:WEB family protein At4g17210 n=1 Tax=Cucurbita maxima TaxID=3661 RepID=A0A6J1JJR1_CUCMA|nr:putative WEB family protein At4g17210 [Cucurbita maxima]
MENMGEIDTKPIDSVQAGISLFGALGDQNKHKLTANNGYEKEREVQELVKDLANYKVQLEAKDAAYMQALLKLEQQQKAIDELSELLKIAETGRDKYVNECSEARFLLGELEQKLNEMTEQSLETENFREKLQAAENELKLRQEELLGIETELAASRESEVKDIIKIELLENKAHLEKETTVDLIRRISELNEAIRLSKFAASEAENEMSAALSAKEAELELAKKQVVELHKQLEEMSQQIEIEMERNQLKEVKFANEEIEKFKDEIETLKNQLEKTKLEMDEMREREANAEVEIALLKSEIHKGRSKVAAAEAAEAKAKSVTSGLYPAVQDLAAESVEVKENIKLKQEPLKAYEETENSILAKPLVESNSSSMEEDLNPEVNERRNESTTMTITLEEYQSSIKDIDSASELSADKISHHIGSECTDELEKLKKELEAASIRIGEFRSRAEQAATRAEMAEKAKDAVEDQLRKWREHKQRRKAALAAMKEVSAPPKFKPPMHEGSSTTYQPLGKVLNLKL